MKMYSQEAKRRQKSEKVREGGMAEKARGRINTKMIETCTLDLTGVTVKRNL